MRPRQRWAYEQSSDPATFCAAYGFGLAKNHGFIDGNKRVAFQVMYVFIGLNGMRLVVEEVEVVHVMVATPALGGSRTAQRECVRLERLVGRHDRCVTP